MKVLPLYSHSSTDRAVNKQSFGKISIEIPDKTDMSANISAGYRAFGFFPINPLVISDAKFAPFLLKHSEDDQVCNVVTATETSSAALLSQQKNRKAFPLSGTSGNVV
jgi:hypothetical protein